MKCKLRRPRITDLESFHYNINDKSIHRFIPEVEYPCKLKTAKNILNDMIKENNQNNKKNFVIDVDGKAIGAIGLTKLIRGHKAEIWSWIGKDYRGRGITTKAIQLVANYAFKRLKLKRISGTLLTNNIASARMLKKSGFIREGILRKNAKINGKFYDDYIYARVK